MTIKKHGGIFGRNPEFSNISNVGSAALKNLTTTDSALNISSSAADGSVTINASGNVGVGGSGTNTVTNGLAVNNATAGNYPGYEIQTADTTRFYINASDAASYIVSVGTSPMVFFTNGGEAARFNSSKNLAFPSGQGIDFSATSGTGTSELFDDYEEGTWVPTLTTDGTDFDSVTYDTVTYGWYTKVGNVVAVGGRLRTDAVTVGAGSGNLVIGGLPFSVVKTGAISIGRATSFVTKYPKRAEVSQGTSYIALFGLTAVNTGTTSLNQTNVGTGTNANYISFSGVYQV